MTFRGFIVGFYYHVTNLMQQHLIKIMYTGFILYVEMEEHMYIFLI